MPAAKRSGNNGNHRPISIRGQRELAILDMVDAAAEIELIEQDLQAVVQLEARVARRTASVRSLIHRAHHNACTAQGREDGAEPTSLATILDLDAARARRRRRRPQPPASPAMAVAA